MKHPLYLKKITKKFIHFFTVRKTVVFLLLSLKIFFLALFIYTSLHLEIPTKEDCFSFYFKEQKKDLKYLLAKCIKEAKQSIYLSSFGLNDIDIIRLLEEQSNHIPIKISYDPKEKTLLPKKDHIETIPYTKGGLMHRKFIGIDKSLILIGSTNITPLALKIHKNLVVCIRSTKLYEAIESNQTIENEIYSFYPLPQSKNEALKKLLETITTAKKQIYVCMYTFTHEELAKALVDAFKRGVDVRVYMDRGMASGVSEKIANYLKSEHVFVQTHLGLGLLHHKCAFVDDTFIFGSANWTKAAFSRNEEYLLFLHRLTKKEISKISKFFTYTEKTSI